MTSTMTVSAAPARNLVAVLTAALLAAAMMLIAGNARAGQAEAPDAFIDRFAAEAIAVLSDPKTDDTVRAAEFRRFLTSKFDLDLVSRFVMGKHWRRATAAQRAEYRTLFEDFIVATYARRLGAYSGETLVTRGVRKAGRKDKAVETVLNRPQGAPVSIAWRLRAQKDGGWRIIDIAVEGVSLAVTQRSEFAAVIRQHGDSIPALIESLRAKVTDAEDGHRKAGVVASASAS